MAYEINLVLNKSTKFSRQNQDKSILGSNVYLLRRQSRRACGIIVPENDVAHTFYNVIAHRELSSRGGR